MTTVRDAVAQLAARIVFDDEAPAEMQVELAQYIEQALADWKRDDMRDLIRRTLRSALEAQIRSAIEAWYRSRDYAQPLQPETEDTAA